MILFSNKCYYTLVYCCVPCPVQRPVEKPQIEEKVDRNSFKGGKG